MVVYRPLCVVIRAVAARAARIVMSVQRNTVNHTVVHNGISRHAVVGRNNTEVGPSTRSAGWHTGAIERVGECKWATDRVPARAEARQVGSETKAAHITCLCLGQVEGSQRVVGVGITLPGLMFKCNTVPTDGLARSQ